MRLLPVPAMCRLHVHRIFKSKKPSHGMSLSIFAAASLTRMDALEAQCRSWAGPQVTALYLYLPLHAAGMQRGAPGVRQGAELPTPEHSKMLKAAEAVVQKVFSR